MDWKRENFSWGALVTKEEEGMDCAREKNWNSDWPLGVILMSQLLV